MFPFDHTDLFEKLPDNGYIFGGRKIHHDCHEKDDHVEHCWDAQRDLLPRLSRDEEDEERQYVDEDSWLDVVEEEEGWSPPNEQVVGYVRKLFLAARVFKMTVWLQSIS